MKKKRVVLISLQLILAFVFVIGIMNGKLIHDYGIAGVDTKGQKTKDFFKTNSYRQMILEDTNVINDVIWANECFSNPDKEIDIFKYLLERLDVYPKEVWKPSAKPVLKYKSGDLIKWFQNESIGRENSEVDMGIDYFVNSVKPSGEVKSLKTYLETLNGGKGVSDETYETAVDYINEAVNQLGEDCENYLNKKELLAGLDKDFQYNVVKTGTKTSVYHSSKYEGMRETMSFRAYEQTVFNSLKKVAPGYTIISGIDGKLDSGGHYQKSAELFKKTYFINEENLELFLILIFILIIGTLILLARDIFKGKDPLNRFDKIKTEIAFILVLIGAFIPLLIGINWSGEYSGNAGRFIGEKFYMGLWVLREPSNVALMCMLLFFDICCLAGFISLMKRIREKTVFKNSLLNSLLFEVKMGTENIKDPASKSFMFRIMILMGINLFLPLIFRSIFYTIGIGVILAIIIDVVFIMKLVQEKLQLDRLISGILEIRKGNLKYKFDSQNFNGYEKLMAESLNEIGEGLDKAVEERLKSERMQTELITNVSHDIKTPLTSIIGYADLIKKENIDSEKMREYVEGLERTSQRLKNLMEDLIEVSKSGSGKLDLKVMEIDFAELVKQLMGDWQDRLDKQGFEMIITMPEEPVVIYADGKATSRIFDNIFGNVCKYALEKSRVYVDLRVHEEKGIASLTVKNISRDVINQSAEELSARFAKGDSARSGEGNGLGLAIAGNLTKLMGGEFILTVDGDLFKVEIILPLK